MTIKLNRRGIEISLAKKCPNCKSTRFKELREPQRKDDVLILKRCKSCGYEWGVNI